MKAGILKHPAVSLLQLYFVCRGPLKPSIFICDVGLCTTHKSVCGSFVAAKRLSGFPRMLGPQTAAAVASWLIASVYVSAVPASNKDTACSFKYILKT